MRIERTFFVDSVSTNFVQLRRTPGLTSMPDADPGLALHQVNITTGVNAAASADTAFWQTGCIAYRVIVERLG